MFEVTLTFVDEGKCRLSLNEQEREFLSCGVWPWKTYFFGASTQTLDGLNPKPFSSVRLAGRTNSPCYNRPHAKILST